MELRKHIYDLISRKRQEQNMSGNELARRAGVAAKTLMKIESDYNYSLGLDVLERLIIALEITGPELIPNSERTEASEEIHKALDHLSQLIKHNV